MVEVIRSTRVEKLPSGLVGRLSGYLDGRGYGVNLSSAAGGHVNGLFSGFD